MPEPAGRHGGKDHIDEALGDYMVRLDNGEVVDRVEFMAEYADVADDIRAYFEHEQELRRLLEGLSIGDFRLEDHNPEYIPAHIGRYRVLEVLGEGGFARVYLAEDEELHRRVAIKVPRRHRVSRREDIEVYLNEARTVAALDHAHIVPVYDVGHTDDGLCYVVSKFIARTRDAFVRRPAGADFNRLGRLRNTRVSPGE